MQQKVFYTQSYTQQNYIYTIQFSLHLGVHMLLAPLADSILVCSMTSTTIIMLSSQGLARLNIVFLLDLRSIPLQGQRYHQKRGLNIFA